MSELTNVHPYHSVHRRDPVYHDRADCPIGKLIHSEELASGTGGRPFCDQCQALHGPEPTESGSS